MEPKDLQKNGAYVGQSVMFPKKSLKLIIENLIENEKILIATSCNSGSKAGAVAVTDKRVIFASKVLFSSEVKDFDIKKITSLNYKSDFNNKMSIKGSSDSIEISAIAKNAGQKIVNRIKEIQNADTESSQKSNTNNGLDNLEKLADLKEKGIITEEEFNAKKKEILNL